MFDRPNERDLWALGGNWKASFDATGCTFVPFCGENAPINFPLRVELLRASVGGEVLALQPGAPTVTDGTVRSERGGCTEHYATTLDQVEQSFVFSTLPKRGELVVDVALHSAMTAAATEHGVRFSNEHGGLDYRDAFAIDARGERITLAIE